MIKKYNIEIVKSLFEKERYTLLSKTYIKASEKLDYICPNGHKHNISWNNFQQGHRCPECYGNVKLTIEEIKESFEKRSAVLLDKEYINSCTKMNYICSKGHRQKICWGSWKAGHGCAVCSGNVKKELVEIKLSFEKEGYTLLTDDYKGNKVKLKYKCPEGHIHEVSWGKWLYGRRCPQCFGGIKKDTIEAIRSYFSERGAKLLSTEYINAHTKLDYVCKEGHKHSITLNSWKKGRGCYVCKIINQTGPNSPTWKGGLSYEPYCEIWKDKEYKEDIRTRDGHKCLNPNCEHKLGIAGRLSIHHIDYNKKNCSPENLITLCNSCNSKANYEREWHEAWYKAILSKRYKYTYGRI